MFHSEVQRGATNVDTIWGNLAQKAFKPLSDKGLCKVPQMWTKIRNVAPLLKGRLSKGREQGYSVENAVCDKTAIDDSVLHKTNNWLCHLLFKQALNHYCKFYNVEQLYGVLDKKTPHEVYFQQH